MIINNCNSLHPNRSASVSSNPLIQSHSDVKKSTQGSPLVVGKKANGLMMQRSRSFTVLRQSDNTRSSPEFLLEHQNDPACRKALLNTLPLFNLGSLNGKNRSLYLKFLLANAEDVACAESLRQTLTSVDFGLLPDMYKMDCLESIFAQITDPAYQNLFRQLLQSFELSTLPDVHRIKCIEFLFLRQSEPICATAFERIMQSLDLKVMPGVDRLSCLQFVLKNKHLSAYRKTLERMMQSFDLNVMPDIDRLHCIKYLFANNANASCAKNLKTILQSLELSLIADFYRIDCLQFISENEHRPEFKQTFERIFRSLDLRLFTESSRLTVINFLFSMKTNKICREVLGNILKSFDFELIPDRDKIKYIDLLYIHREDPEYVESFNRAVLSLNFNVLPVKPRMDILNFLFSNKDDPSCTLALLNILPTLNWWQLPDNAHRTTSLTILFPHKENPACLETMINILQSWSIKDKTPTLREDIGSILDALDNFYLFLAKNIVDGVITHPHIHKSLAHWLLRNNDLIMEDLVYQMLGESIQKNYIADPIIKTMLVDLITKSCSKIPEGLKMYGTVEDIRPRNIKYFNEVMRANRHNMTHACCVNAALSCAYEANTIPLSEQTATDVATKNLSVDPTRLAFIQQHFDVINIPNKEKNMFFIDMIKTLKDQGYLKYGVLVNYQGHKTTIGHVEFVYEDHLGMYYSTSETNNQRFRYAWKKHTEDYQSIYWTSLEQRVTSIWVLAPKNVDFMTLHNIPRGKHAEILFNVYKEKRDRGTIISGYTIRG